MLVQMKAFQSHMNASKTDRGSRVGVAADKYAGVERYSSRVMV